MNRRTFHSLAFSTAASTLVPAAANETNDNDSATASKPAQKIKIAQIGTKHAHAAGQLETLRKCADFEVIGICEPDPEQQKKVAGLAAYQGLPWMNEEQLLNLAGLQALCIETEVSHLLKYAQLGADLGLHLHIDKPAGEDLAQFKRVLDTTTSKNRLVKMGYMFRYNPAFQMMIQAVREGWLGNVFSIHAEMSKQLAESERMAMLPYSGGSMFELGCHLIDSVIRVLGAPDKITAFPRQHGQDGFADNMLSVFEYAKATVSIRSAMIEVHGGSRRQFTVCGDQGTFEIFPLEHPSARLFLDQTRGKYRKGIHSLTFEKTPRYAADWSAFAKAIRDEIAWEFHAEHDYTVQKSVLQASGLIA